MTRIDRDKEDLRSAIVGTRSAYRAAKLLGITPQTVYNWLDKFNYFDQGKLPIRKLAARLRMFHVEQIVK